MVAHWIRRRTARPTASDAWPGPRGAHPAAVSVLLDTVQDPEPHFRQNVQEALLPLLDENPYVRMGLTQVLHTAQDAEVRQRLADALGILLEFGASGANPAGMSR